jgi:hypothetical protein
VKFAAFVSCGLFERILIMKYAYLPTVASTMILAISTLSASHALAADPEKPKTRAEVLQELEDAQRTGEIPANDESGLKLNEEYPQRYPTQEAGPSLAREQVRRDLEEARRTGKIPRMPVEGD